VWIYLKVHEGFSGALGVPGNPIATKDDPLSSAGITSPGSGDRRPTGQPAGFGSDAAAVRLRPAAARLAESLAAGTLDGYPVRSREAGRREALVRVAVSTSEHRGARCSSGEHSFR